MHPSQTQLSASTSLLIIIKDKAKRFSGKTFMQSPKIYTA